MVTCITFSEAINGSLFFFLCELWDFISHFIKKTFLLGDHSCFQVLMVLFFFSKLLFGIQFAVEFTEDICNNFS